MDNIWFCGFQIAHDAYKKYKISVLKYSGPVCLDGIPFSVQSCTFVFWPLILFNWAQGSHVDIISLYPSFDNFC